MVSRLYLWPTIACICYTQYQHVDMLGNVCHGTQYKSEHSAKISFAPWLSTTIKLWICNILHKGFTPQQILQHHIELLQRSSMEGTLHIVQHTFLTLCDILKVASNLEIVTLQMDIDDARSVHNWAIANSSHTFFYQKLDHGGDG